MITRKVTKDDPIIKEALSKPNFEFGGSVSYIKDGVKNIYTPQTKVSVTSGGTGGGTSSGNSSVYRDASGTERPNISQEILDAYAMGNYGALSGLENELRTKVAKQGGYFEGGNVSDWLNSLRQQYAAPYNNYMNTQKQLQALQDLFKANNNVTTKYDDIYQSLLDKYNKFTFDDFTQSSAYQGLKNLYETSGKRAMRDTLGEIAARTGGYASSYAAAAAEEQYNDYMTRLANLAEQMYSGERNSMRADLQNLGGRIDNEISRITANNNNYYNTLAQIYNNQYETDRADRLTKENAEAQAAATARQNAIDEISYQLDHGFDISDLNPDTIALSGLSYEQMAAMAKEWQDKQARQDLEDSWKERELAAKEYSAYNKSTGRSSGGSRRSSSQNQNTNTSNGKWEIVDDWASTYSYYDKDKNGNKVYHDAGEDYVKEHYKELGYSSQTAALSGYKNHKNESALENAEIGNRYDDGGIYVLGYGYISSDELIALLEEGKINQKYDKTTNKVYYSKR